MAKGARKRQRTTDSTSLETLTQSDILSHQKDSEEKRLENLLFGTNHVLDSDDERMSADSAEIHDAGTALENMMDTDLFFLDDQAAPSMLSDETMVVHQSDKTPAPSYAQRSTPRTAAWSDPADEPIQVSVNAGRSRKLRDAPDEVELSGREYESRLRRQYERINPQPEWAKKKKHKRARSTSSATDEGEDEAEDLNSSTMGIARQKKSTTLLKGTLAIERLRDANQSAQSSDAGAIRALAFHPSDNVPVLCVASADRRARLFNIDGHTNPLLQTLHIPSLPITTTTFHPSGSELLLTGPRPFFHIYDLNTGHTHRSSRGLWGTTFSNTSQGESMETVALGSSTLAVAGRSGYVHLVDWKTGGASGQVVGSLKTGTGQNVRSLSWLAEDRLIGLTADAEVYLWDVGQRKCVKRWKDEGGYRNSSSVMDARSGWIGIGSSSGFVNVYGSDAFDPAASTPRLAKSIANITTPVSCVKVNHDGQLMAIASQEKKDAMRLIHLPSLTAFANWPNSGTPLGRVTAVDFSPKSDYVAIGNKRGKVLLYHLRDYVV